MKKTSVFIVLQFVSIYTLFAQGGLPIFDDDSNDAEQPASIDDFILLAMLFGTAFILFKFSKKKSNL